MINPNSENRTCRGDQQQHLAEAKSPKTMAELKLSLKPEAQATDIPFTPSLAHQASVDREKCGLGFPLAHAVSISLLGPEPYRLVRR